MTHLGLCGEKGSGKSVLADILVEDHGYTKYSLADPIKRGLQAMGVPEEYLWGARKEEELPFWPVTGRLAMQTLGTEWGRHVIGDDCWVSALDMIVQADMEACRTGLVVVDDVRFPNEADWIKCFDNEPHTYPGAIIRVNRGTMGSADTHVSEEGLPLHYVDHSVDNDGNIEQLRGVARTLVKQTLPLIANNMEL